MTVLLIILVLVLIGLWKFGKFETVSNGIKNIWNRAGSSAPPAPGTATPPAPGTPAAQPLWKRWAWPVGIIVVILALANASVREALWTTGAPAVHSWTTGAKTFNVTIKSTDEFVIGTVDGGNWDVDVSNVPYTCSTSADSGYYSGDTAAARRTCPSDIDCPAPNLYLSSLLITTGNDKSGYVGPGQMIALRNGDVLKGVLNHHRRCTLYTPINVRVTLTKH